MNHSTYRFYADIQYYDAAAKLYKGLPDNYDNPVAEQNSAIDNNYYLECELAEGI